jgi:preprotein translocase subunit SecG
MYIALIILHVVLCIVLIVTILLQAGKGGGLTEMFGGDTAQSVLGTQAPALLKKITEVSAVGFIVTSLALGMVTARRGQSLFEGQALPHIPVESSAALPFIPGEAIPEPEGDVSLPPVEPIDISEYDAVSESEQEDLFIPEEQN